MCRTVTQPLEKIWSDGLGHFSDMCYAKASMGFYTEAEKRKENRNWGVRSKLDGKRQQSKVKKQRIIPSEQRWESE